MGKAAHPTGRCSPGVPSSRGPMPSRSSASPRRPQCRRRGAVRRASRQPSRPLRSSPSVIRSVSTGCAVDAGRRRAQDRDQCGHRDRRADGCRNGCTDRLRRRCSHAGRGAHSRRPGRIRRGTDPLAQVRGRSGNWERHGPEGRLTRALAPLSPRPRLASPATGRPRRRATEASGGPAPPPVLLRHIRRRARPGAGRSATAAGSRSVPAFTSRSHPGACRRRPCFTHPALDHRAHRVRMGHGEENVADDHGEDGQGQDVVDERGPRAPTDREESEPLQDAAGGQHDDDGSTDEYGVQLLTGIEFVDDPRCVAPNERSHATSSRVHRLIRRRSRRICAPHGPTSEMRIGTGQRDATPDVDIGHQRPPTDHAGQRGKYRARAVSIRMPNKRALAQCAARCTRSNRKILPTD